MEKGLTSKRYLSSSLDNIEFNCKSAKFNKTEKLARISKKIERLLTDKNINKSTFASLMCVQPSVVTRWLSGSHNFTIDTLLDIENCLEEEIIVLNSLISTVTVRFEAQGIRPTLSTGEVKIGIVDYEHSYRPNNIIYEPKSVITNGNKELIENGEAV